ncbi:hypothetical protein AGMMS49944_00200 [Spirochaetia bacterium]|nr:hypothetical protein AGMMS49944_00200 [Spirochaetia bacterium]
MHYSRLTVTGEYLGINSRKGIGLKNARVFVKSDNTIVDGLFPIADFKKLKKGDKGTFDLTEANDPKHPNRTFV